LLSSNGCFKLILEWNGNLIIRQVKTGNVVWATNTTAGWNFTHFFSTKIKKDSVQENDHATFSKMITQLSD
jgi:hypothetical protein